MNTDKSTPIAIKYFENQGYSIELVKQGGGFDFWIIKDKYRNTVEAKLTVHNLLPLQIERLKEGGLLAEVDKKGKVTILKYEDIELIRPSGWMYRRKSTNFISNFPTQICDINA